MNKRIRLVFTAVLSFLLLFTTVSASVLAAYPISATFIADYNGQRTVLYQQYQDRPGGLALVNTYYSAGSRSWRNNNPGNMKSAKFTTDNGAIAVDDGNFAIFPDYYTGYAAMKTKVTVDYKDKTIRQLITIWAPPEDGNDTEGYIRSAVQKVGGGVTESTKVSSLTASQQTALCDAIQVLEGYSKGTISTAIGYIN